MAGSMTEIPVNGDNVPAYVSLPPSGSGPGVVVIQEWWGLVPHIRNVAARLAAQGFVALAPDLDRGKETTEPD
jgi:carboxymethylenebutenolidase